MPTWWVLVVACAGRPAENPAPPPHFAGWGNVASQVARGQLDAARATARALTGAESGDDAGRVGAALGMIAVAEDRGEALDAVVAGTAACRSCHADAGVAPPPARPWDHDGAAEWLVDRAVWGRTDPLPSDDVGKRASAAPDLRGQLESCGECHAPVPEPAPGPVPE